MSDEKKADEARKDEPKREKDSGVACPKCKGRNAIKKGNALKCPACGFQSVSV